MMKYQRVLYTSRLTAEIRSRLRIIAYKKRPSLKKNVYFVGFASDADVKSADRSAKRLQNVTMKPIQPFPSNAPRGNQFGLSNNRPHSSSPSSLTPSLPFLSPPTTLSFLSHCHSTFVASQRSPARADETLEERARRILGPIIASQQNDRSILSARPSNFIHPAGNLNPGAGYMNTCEKSRRQIIDSVQSCLKTMKQAQRASDHIYELHKRGIDCCAAMDHLFQVHSTAFYLKATASSQIKAAYLAGVRMSWSDIAHLIGSLEADIHHQQSFVTQTASAKYISSKIDSATSIAMSSKLAYQLTKLSD